MMKKMIMCKPAWWFTAYVSPCPTCTAYTAYIPGKPYYYWIINTSADDEDDDEEDDGEDDGEDNDDDDDGDDDDDDDVITFTFAHFSEI